MSIELFDFPSISIAARSYHQKSTGQLCVVRRLCHEHVVDAHVCSTSPPATSKLRGSKVQLISLSLSGMEVLCPRAA